MEIVLHLGAHKTATTYLQNRLDHSAAALAETGLFLATPSVLRPKPSSQQKRLGMDGFLRLWGQKSRAERVADLYRQAQDARATRFVLSEENFLGSLEPLLTSAALYGAIPAALGPVLQVFANQPVTVLLAIRDYRHFFVSAYGQSLRRGVFYPFDAPLKQRLLAMERGWTDVVDDIESVLPGGSRLRLWNYADMADREETILSAIVGRDRVDAVAPYNFQPLPGPSYRAIRRLTELHNDGEVIDLARIRSIFQYHRKSKGFAAFDPWTPLETRLLDDWFACDLSCLMAERMDCFLHSRLYDSPVAIPA